MTRGEIWWADLGPYRTPEQTGRRPVIVWQSDTLTRLLQSVLVEPLTTNPIEEFKGEYRCIESDLRNANSGQSSGPLEIDRSWDAYTDTAPTPTSSSP